MSEPLTPMSEEVAQREADRIIATAFRDPTPLPAIGPTPPVPQPGRPPMSQSATDASALMLSGSVLTLAVGGTTTAILWASGHADPAVIALIAGAPTALVLALARLLRNARAAQPDQHHHHYTGPVYQDQRTQQTKTSGLWARTDNHQ